MPLAEDLDWVAVVEPRFVPSEWLALDLGAGELAAMALAWKTRIGSSSWMTVSRGALDRLPA